jgi:hypothetical protein
VRKAEPKMTLKEKVKEINPECVNDSYGGGVSDCPSEYEYLHDNKNALNCGWVGRWWNKEVDCEKCWNREYKGD